MIYNLPLIPQISPMYVSLSVDLKAIYKIACSSKDNRMVEEEGMERG